MANYPKKMMDPTEAALSAIQEALNIRDDDDQDHSFGPVRASRAGRGRGLRAGLKADLKACPICSQATRGRAAKLSSCLPGLHRHRRH